VIDQVSDAISNAFKLEVESGVVQRFFPVAFVRLDTSKKTFQATTHAGGDVPRLSTVSSACDSINRN
jgi:hypothetical protein